MVVDISSPHFLKTKCDNAGHTRPTHGNNSAKVQIMYKENSVFLNCLVDDVLIFQIMQSLLAKVNCIVSTVSKKDGAQLADAHVQQKFHAATSVGV